MGTGSSSGLFQNGISPPAEPARPLRRSCELGSVRPAGIHAKGARRGADPADRADGCGDGSSGVRVSCSRANLYALVLIPALALALAAPPAASPFAPGERMEYAVRYLGLQVGKARISVGHAEGPILPVFLESRTSGIVRIVDVRQQLATHLDLETLLPRSSSLDAVEAGYHHSDTTLFDRIAGKATVRQQGKFDNTYLVEVPEGTLDFVALVFRLRVLPLEPGLRHEFHVLAGRNVRQVAAEVIARETIETRAGSFPAVKVRVPTGFTGKFSEKHPTYVWFTDDARRVVVQITTEFAIGRATAGLTAYHPGEPRG